MHYKIEPTVIAEIERQFAEIEWKEVESVLSKAKLWAEKAAPPPRVHIAFLDLAEGSLGDLKDIVAHHSGDWRDALVSAGLANEDWRERLVARGIDPQTWG